MRIVTVWCRMRIVTFWCRIRMRGPTEDSGSRSPGRLTPRRLAFSRESHHGGFDSRLRAIPRGTRRREVRGVRAIHRHDPVDGDGSGIAAPSTVRRVETRRRRSRDAISGVRGALRVFGLRATIVRERAFARRRRAGFEPRPADGYVTRGGVVAKAPSPCLATTRWTCSPPRVTRTRPNDSPRGAARRRRTRAEGRPPRRLIWTRCWRRWWTRGREERRRRIGPRAETATSGDERPEPTVVVPRVSKRLSTRTETG